MATLNKVTLIGNLGTDPQLKSATTDKSFGVLSLATRELRKDKEGKPVTHMEWHHILVFNEHVAQFASQYLHKGDLVYVEGQLKTFESTNEQGEKIKNLRIVIPRYEGQVLALHQIKKEHP